jgi:hypothetical protein
MILCDGHVHSKVVVCRFYSVKFVWWLLFIICRDSKNDLCHRDNPRTEEALVAQIQWEVRSRLMFRRKIERSAMFVRLVQIWKL